MIVVAKKIGRPTSRAARTTCMGTVSPGPGLREMWEKMLSTMISVASTMMPKSIAPSEIRLADSPTNTIMQNVNRSAIGTVRATMTAVLKWPRKTNRTTNTSAMPLITMSVTVSIVVWINTIRS